MRNVDLKRIKLTRANIVNRVMSGERLDVNVEVKHAVTPVTNNMCETSDTISLTRKVEDPSMPFEILLEVSGTFSVLSNPSPAEIFEQTVNYTFPYLQAYLNQLLGMTGFPPIYLPASSVPTYPENK